MFKFSAVSQIWKKYIQKLNDWDLPLRNMKVEYMSRRYFHSNLNRTFKSKEYATIDPIMAYLNLTPFRIKVDRFFNGLNFTLYGENTCV